MGYHCREMEKKMGKKRIKLMIYGLSVIDEKNNRVFLDNVIDNKSLICCVEEYINSHIFKYTTDSSRDTLFQFEQVNSEVIKNEVGQDEYTVLCGRVKTGEYGIKNIQEK